MLDTLVYVVVLGLAFIGFVEVVDMLLDDNCEHLPCMRGQHRGVYYLLCSRCRKVRVGTQWVHPRLAMFQIDDILADKQRNGGTK